MGTWDICKFSFEFKHHFKSFLAPISLQLKASGEWDGGTAVRKASTHRRGGRGGNGVLARNGVAQGGAGRIFVRGQFFFVEKRRSPWGGGMWVAPGPLTIILSSLLRESHLLLCVHPLQRQCDSFLCWRSWALGMCGTAGPEKGWVGAGSSAA